MNRDTLESVHRFATAVAEALEAANVDPTIYGDFCGVIVLAANDEDEAPVGASLSYDDVTGLWTVEPQAMQSTPVEDDDDNLHYLDVD